jgi:DNA-binding LytR/AlgR family response regulator
LLISNHDSAESVAIENIVYFRSIDKHVFAYINERGEILVDYTLKELESLFSKRVVRTHRSALVNIDYLLKLQRDTSGGAYLELRDTQETIPVSRRHFAAIKKCFQN